MPGLDPGIHVAAAQKQLSDARVKPGHDESIWIVSEAGLAGRLGKLLRLAWRRRLQLGIGVANGGCR